MSQPIIKVENLSKQYRLGSVGTGTLRNDFQRFWANLLGKEDPTLKIGQENTLAKQQGTTESDYVWALKDINFEVKQGEILGIIGKNGAGKSTLLKILSQVTTPSEGNVKIKGRIASLLEVGTGFHPELTGRENIFLNGAILGMTKAEVRSKFDEIVDFSGVSKYIDTPVKRYSSGMYVRLAFAVAAYLEPEILIVDEILAVGDTEFQKKALGKMQEVSKGKGRTVLFVSHNMAAIKSLCSMGIILKNGSLAFKSSAIEAVTHYQNNNQVRTTFKKNSQNWEIGNENIKIINFEVFPTKGDIISISSGIDFEIQFFNCKENINLDATFEVVTIEDLVVFHHGALITQKSDSKRGFYKVRGILPPYLLNAGTYKFNLIFGENQRFSLFRTNDFIQFEVMNESLGSNNSVLPGVLRPDIHYNINFINP